MLNINLNTSSNSAQLDFKAGASVGANINVNFGSNNNQQYSNTQLNQKQILKDCYAQGSPQNGQFFFPKQPTQQVKLNTKPQPVQVKSIQTPFRQSQPQAKPQQAIVSQSIKQTHQESKTLNLKNNKFLKGIFDHFCNISYADTKKQTFEQMQKKNQTMSLNRFMLFCKEFDIYSIMKHDIKHQNLQKSFVATNSMVKTINKPQQKSLQKSQSKYLSNQSKHRMLQIPVKQIIKFQKKMSKTFKAYMQKNQKLTYDNFLKIIQEIYKIFVHYISEIFPTQNLNSDKEIRCKFLQKVLHISSSKEYRIKMDSLKIQFKGSISYHHEYLQKRSSQKYYKKPLVMHGGRYQDQIKNQLQVYQGTKIKKTQSWISSQPQMTGLYSKSRVFYKPNPSKIYQTNDVIRLARCEAGKTKTQSLFDYTKVQQAQKRQTIHQNKKQQIISFNKIFEDKTNSLFEDKNNLFGQKLKDQSFGEKLQKLKEKYAKRQKISKQRQKDDEILSMYFQNQRKTYGQQNIHMKTIV